jgi:putative peptidoglycan lipid II flippase
MVTGRKIIRATVLIFVLNLLSRLLGLGREMAIAYRFGATEKTDAFMLALTIPNIFYSVVGMALAAVIVPLFEEYEIKGRREEIWQVLSIAVNFIILVIGTGIFLGIKGSSFIVGVLGPGFPAETRQLAINLTALMIPSVLFITLAGVWGGIMNANQIFGPAALGPAAMNLAIILSALAGLPRLGIYNLAVGTLGGALFFALIQVPSLRRVGFKYSLALNVHDSSVRQVLKLVAPILIVTGISQIYTIIDLRFASGLAAGSIAALNYARKLMQLPQGLFVAAVTTAIFPTLSKLAAEDKIPDMALILQKALRVILFLAIPGSVGLIVLRYSIVILLFERGAFDPLATVRTADALLYYTLGLFSLCLYLPLTRAFFALKDMTTPLWTMVCTLGIKILLSFTLASLLMHCGLALATSLTVMINVAVLSCLLCRRLPKLFDRSFISFVSKTITAALLMGLIVWGVDTVLSAYLIAGGMIMTIRVVIDVTLGLGVFLLFGLVLKLDETRYVISLPFRLIEGG